MKRTTFALPVGLSAGGGRKAASVPDFSSSDTMNGSGPRMVHAGPNREPQQPDMIAFIEKATQ